MIEESYYSRNKDRLLTASKERYYKNREKRLAYQAVYDAKKRADGTMKKYKRKYVPRPRGKYNLKNPKPPRERKPKLPPEPRKPKYEFPEASFSMTLD